MEYYTRYVEKSIKNALETSGAIVVTGPKFCGKTTTSKLFASSSFSLDTKAKIMLGEANPSDILIGESPRLIDEWQNIPDLWNEARVAIDASDKKFGLFIFTGSSTPADKKEIYHSGAGRIVSVMMRPLSLYESRESTGAVSLKALFDGQKKVFYANEGNNLIDIAFYICRGGWPLSVLAGREKALRVTKNYVSTLFEFENNKNAKFRNKKKSTFITMLKSYARNISSEVRRKILIDDISSHEDRGIDPDTFDSYKEALEDLYIIKDIDAWNPNFRSKTSVITTPTRHFVDTSIAANVLNISPSYFINDPETFGLFFEDFAVKELSVYTDFLGGEVRHYRDSNGLECDAVIHLEDGRYGIIEIKLGGESLINYGRSRLNLLENRLINEGNHAPAFKMILTATGSAYTTEDGVHIVPVNTLKD